MKTVQDILSEDMKRSLNKAIQHVFNEEYAKYRAPDYYSKRKYGKWTIYNKEGMRVAWGLNEREMKAYMKLLKTEE
jgi:glycogen synthase